MSPPVVRGLMCVQVLRDQGLLHEAPGFVGDVPVVGVLLSHGGEEKLLGEHLIVLFDQHLFHFRVEVVDAGHFYKSSAVLRAEF